MKNLRLLFVLIIFVLPALIAGIRPDIFKILISPLKNFIIYSETMDKIEDNFVYFGILIIIVLLIILVIKKFRS